MLRMKLQFQILAGENSLLFESFRRILRANRRVTNLPALVNVR